MRVVPVLAVVLVLIGITRIASTYSVFNHTIDEPTHIGCGLQWLRDRRSDLEMSAPPLARIAVALGSERFAGPAIDHPNTLYQSQNYHRALTAARVGILPFFVLASVIVFLWAKRISGEWAGLSALALFTTLPPILAHSGLATTDMAVAATAGAAGYASLIFLDRRTGRSAILLGLAMGSALLSKYIFLVFFPVILLVVMAFTRRLPPLKGTLLSVGTCLLVWWSLYWFRLSPVEGYWLPAGDWFRGVMEIKSHNQFGHLSYLWGEVRTQGWWYFFPVILLFKTPLPFLILLLVAALTKRREVWIPILCAIGMLLVVLPSHINLGVRYLLPLYPFAAVATGAGMVSCWNAKGFQRWLVVALLCWQVAVSTGIHPNYLTYFNEIAGDEKEMVRVDSDLDWGQSFQQLAVYLKQNPDLGKVAFDGFGSVAPGFHGLDYRPMSPWVPEKGWVAISATRWKMTEDAKPRGEFREPWFWLKDKQPTRRLFGGSILLFRID
jgi:hypothetical protein